MERETLWREGVSHFENRRWSEAVTLLRQIEADPPDPALFLEYMGKSLFQMGEYSVAQVYLCRWLELSPHSEAFRLAAIAYGQIEEYDKSVDLLIRGESLYPEDPEVPSLLGATLRTVGRLEEAKAAFARALALKADHVGALCGLGVTLGILGDARSAKESLLKAVSVAPHFAPAHFHLGVTCHALGQAEEALRELAALRALGSTFAPTLEKILNQNPES